MSKYKVAIYSICYNHAPYVEKTLDGFSAQKTDFPFVDILIDDASTDGTQDVIKKYIEEHFVPDDMHKDLDTDDAIILFRKHNQNKNFHIIIIFLKNNYYQQKKQKEPVFAKWAAGSDYWAFCECDDYWIDEYKLQKESDFLDSHPEYGLVYTDFDIHYYDTGKYIQAAFKNGLKPIITSFEEHLVKAAYIAPMSWLCRIPMDKLMEGYQGPSSIDTSFIMALEFFLHSKVYYMDTVTCVYGKHAGSATKQTSLSKQYLYAHDVYSTQKYYIDTYNLRHKYPNCLDYFLNAYYCYIISHQKEEDYSEVLSFFHRKGKQSLKFYLFDKMMRLKFTMPVLRAICKYRIKNQ